MKTRLEALGWIGLCFAIGFVLTASVILGTTQTASVNPEHIPFSVRASYLFLPLLGPWAVLWGDRVGGWEYVALTWSAVVALGVAFPRATLARIFSCFAAGTWPIVSLLWWALVVS